VDCGPPFFEPPVFGTVDLHQFTQTIASRPRLVDAPQPVFLSNPKASADHPLLQRLDAEIQAVNLGQLLGRQGPTKSCVAATLLRDQTVRTVNSERIEQPVNPPSANPDQPGSIRDRYPSVANIYQHPQTRQLVAAHLSPSFHATSIGLPQTGESDISTRILRMKPRF
jgi:hypothetical protein